MKSHVPPYRKIRLALAVAGPLIFGSVTAQAATQAWATTPTSGNFADSNWTVATTPATTGTDTVSSGDSLYFGTSSTTALTNNDTGFTFAGITFNSGASAFTIGGNSFTLMGPITNNSTTAEIINAPIVLGATENVTDSTGSMTLGGIISDGGAGYGITKLGTGILTLTGADTYSGATLNANGNIYISGAGSLADSAITIGVPGSGVATYLNISPTGGAGTTTYANGLTFNGSYANGQNFNNFNVTATAMTGNTVDSFGALTINSGMVATSVAAPSGYNVQLDFASLTRSQSGILYLGRSTTGVGADSIASDTAASANIVFSTAPTLSGAGGAAGTAYISILPYVDDGGFATYDSTKGLRPLASGETVALASGLSTSGGAAGQNATTSGVSISGNTTINSLSGGGTVSFNADSTTLTISSGGVIAGTNLTFGSGTVGTNGTIALGAAEGIFIAENGRTLTLNSAITGSQGATFALDNYNGSNAKIVLNGANTYTGITTIEANQGSVTFDLTNSLALQDSTLNYNSFGVGLTFGNGGTTGQTAYTFGGLEGSQNINLNNNDTTVGAVALTVGGDNDANDTYSGILSNTVAGGSLIKVGTGTLTLTGANTYSGGTTINAGTVDFASGSLGTSGAITVSGGTLQWASGNTQDISSRLTLANGSTATLDTQGNNVTLGTVFGGSTSGALTKVGTGTLTLGSIANTFTGITSINQGTVSVSAVNTGVTAQPLGENPAINLGGASTSGTLQYTSGSNQTLDKNFTLGAAGGTLDATAAGNLTLTGDFTGSSNLTINNSGGGIIFLSGANNSNSFTGNLIIDAGTVRPGITTPLNSNNILSNGGTFNMGTSSGVTFAGINDIAGATGGTVNGGSANPSLTLAGAGTYVSSDTIAFQGSGKLVVSLTGAGSQTLNGNITTFSGGVTLNSGKLTLGGADTYTGPTNINGGAMIVSGSLSGTSTINVNAGSLEVDGAVTDPTIGSSGTLSGIGSVGPITANGGTLAPGLTAADSSTSTGALTTTGAVSLSGSTNFNIRLGFAVSGTDSDSLAVTNSGVVTLNDAILNLTLGSNLASAANDTFYTIINGGAGGTGSGSDIFAGLVEGDTFSVGNATFDIFYADNGTGVLDSGNNVDVELLTAIPEPSTWGMMISGTCMLIAVQRRRRRRY